MLNITHYQRNENQTHNEVPSHARQNGFYPSLQTINLFVAKLLERVCRKGNPLTLLVGMQTNTAAMENAVEIP